MFRVMVIKGKHHNTVHIWDNDHREAVFMQRALNQLIMILKKAQRAKGIPIEELDEDYQFRKPQKVIESGMTPERVIKTLEWALAIRKEAKKEGGVE